jgi:hypothetical protein
MTIKVFNASIKPDSTFRDNRVDFGGVAGWVQVTNRRLEDQWSSELAVRVDGSNEAIFNLAVGDQQSFFSELTSLEFQPVGLDVNNLDDPNFSSSVQIIADIIIKGSNKR